nr:hypothetical protein [Tanacetum cinerariifolium]
MKQFPRNYFKWWSQVSAAGEVNVASIARNVSAAATITTKKITLAQALVEIKTSKPKAKGIILQEPSECITTTTKIIYSKQSQDKGKGIMVEESIKLKKKDQIRLDEEAAIRLQAELQAEFKKEQRLAREKAKKEQEANIALIETCDVCSKFVEGSSKRAGEELVQESLKKQKVDEDKETTKLKKLIKIIPDEEEVEIDDIPLIVKSPKIVDWKIQKEGKKSYYQIIRADGNSKMYMGRIVRIKSHLNAVGITAAHINVNTALMKLVLLVNFKDNILSGYYC